MSDPKDEVKIPDFVWQPVIFSQSQSYLISEFLNSILLILLTLSTCSLRSFLNLQNAHYILILGWVLTS